MNKPIRILHVFGRLDRGGAETFVMNVFRHIDRSKVMFDFMVHTQDRCAYDDEIKGLGGRIYRMPAYRAFNHFGYKKKWRGFFEGHGNRHKIVHGHMTSTAAVYLEIAKEYGVLTVSHSHNDSFGKGPAARLKEAMQSPLRRIPDYMLACSEAAGIYCYGADACKRDDFFVVNNAIETERFICDPAMGKLKRKEFGVEGKFVIGHIGRFMEQKNHAFLIDVFKEVHERNKNSAPICLTPWMSSCFRPSGRGLA